MHKKYLTVLLAVPFLLTGCNKPGPATETHYEADGTMTSKTTFRYSGKNLVEVNAEDLMLDGSYQKAKTVIDYNGDLMTKSTTYYWNEDIKAWGETYYSYYNYDNNKNLIIQYGMMVGEKEVVPFDLFVDVFDDKNRVVTEQSYDYYEGVFYVATQKSYSYNEKGLKSREDQYTSMFTEDGSLELTGYLLYSYNENDTLSKISEFNRDGLLRFETRYTYKDNSLNPSEVACVEIDGDEELTKWKDVYEYNGSGKMIKDSYYHLDDERVNLILDSYIIYTY